MEGITESMRQYEESTSVVWKNKPKNMRPYGIKRPRSENLLLVIGGIILLFAFISEVIL